MPLLLKLSKKYGPVFRVYVAHKKMVVLAGYTAVKQALVNQAEDFGEREVFPIFHDFNKGNGMRAVKIIVVATCFCSQFELWTFRNTVHQWRPVERNEALCSDYTKRFWDGKKNH